MNEHDEYPRTRGMVEDPKALRWVILGLIAFWVGTIALIVIYGS